MSDSLLADMVAAQTAVGYALDLLMLVDTPSWVGGAALSAHTQLQMQSGELLGVRDRIDTLVVLLRQRQEEHAQARLAGLHIDAGEGV